MSLYFFSCLATNFSIAAFFFYSILRMASLRLSSIFSLSSFILFLNFIWISLLMRSYSFLILVASSPYFLVKEFSYSFCLTSCSFLCTFKARRSCLSSRCWILCSSSEFLSVIYYSFLRAVTLSKFWKTKCFSFYLLILIVIWCFSSRSWFSLSLFLSSACLSSSSFLATNQK